VIFEACSEMDVESLGASTAGVWASAAAGARQITTAKRACRVVIGSLLSRKTRMAKRECANSSTSGALSQPNREIGYGSFMNRREWLKAAASVGGAALLPNVTGLLGAAGDSQAAPAAGRERLLADFGWRFHLGHANDPALDFGYGRGNAFAKSGSVIPGGGRGNPGLAQAAFDDSQWTAVDLPHDWAIDLPFISDRGANAHGAKPLGRTYPETSIGWYRRTFDIPATDLGRRIAIEFDGVFRDAIVILNGHYIGRNLSGYAPFRFDVTDFITYGGKNVMIVRADATESEGWFYEGAGIYRHVWVEKTAPLHVAHWGTFVRLDAPAQVSSAGATVTVQTEIAKRWRHRCRLRGCQHNRRSRWPHVATATSDSALLGAWSRRMVTQSIAIAKPVLWSLEDPHLYRLQTAIATGSANRGAGPIADRYDTPFGIRTIQFDADKDCSSTASR